MSNIFHDNMALQTTRALRSLNDFLARGQALVVATIVPVCQKPGPAIGFKVLVDRDGHIVGEREGGGLERKISREAALVWRSGLPRLVDCTGLGDIEDQEAGISGSIERLFLEPIEPDSESVHLFRLLSQRLDKGLPSLLVSALPAGSGGVRKGMGRCLLGPEGVLAGNLPANVPAAQALGAGWERMLPAAKTLGETPCFLEPILPFDPVFVIGAGKVGRLVAELASLAAFRVVVMDDDPWYASPARFPLAEERVVLKDFDACFAGRRLGPEASVVIMTRGHAHDREVLAQALRTPAGYIGLMGCKAEGLARVAEVGRTGFAQADIARVRCPIGLPIGGATPEETALSVVAELVSARTQRIRALALATDNT
jgi:xanthine dehydrogenase accessory factor